MGRLPERGSSGGASQQCPPAERAGTALLYEAPQASVPRVQARAHAAKPLIIAACARHVRGLRCAVVLPVVAADMQLDGTPHGGG
jgi:hypothetical protein